MKKINSAMLVGKFVDALKCPLCENDMRVADLKSLVCKKKHTFDFAKQGYVNLLSRPASTTQYNKELFGARHNIVFHSNLYRPMHEAMQTVITEFMDVSAEPFIMADLGCGEGSHLQKILEGCNFATMTGIGLDVSREGIFMAAKRYGQGIWFVGDLAKSPFKDQSLNVILNILSPANYKEFKRILAHDGLVIKVVPGANYLKELREAFFPHSEKRAYQNDDTVALFKRHFLLLDEIHLMYTKKLQQEELEQLVKMTPLAWSAKAETIKEFMNRDCAEITVDLDILVGKHS